MTRWAKITKGDRVELKGADFEVVKIKPKGKRAKVTVRGKRGTFESVVDLDAKVKRAPLREGGRQKRWATQRELDRRTALGPGRADLTAPPRKPGADPWETRRDKVERLLESALEAKLVGEGTDEEGYYVPPADVTTIDAHLVLFHGTNNVEADYGADHATRLAAHAAEHAELAADPMSPRKPFGYAQHWHTETRPKASK